MKDFASIVFGIVVVVGLLSLGSQFVGCDNVKAPPKFIEADGQTYTAYKDFIWISSEGGGVLGASEIFKVTFTDPSGLSHTLRGLKKVTVSDAPATVAAPMPSNPGFTTSDGKPVVEGYTYTWSDGTKARFHNGRWQPVQVTNDLCKRPEE
jgi:hypothetical protein